MSLENPLNIIGLAADILAILGIGGLFTWSFVSKDNQDRDIADIGISVFVIAIRLVLSFFFLCALFLPAALIHFIIVALFSGNFGASDGFWHPDKVKSYTLAYTIVVLLGMPTAVLGVSSIFTWSVGPFRRFLDILTKRSSS